MYATATFQYVALLLASFMSSTTTALRSSKSKDAIKLSQVKTLTFKHGEPTKARRVDAIPQISCVGGSAAGLYNVDVMQCKNSGSEYDVEDIQWKCTASLPPEFKLGSTEVLCEGYDSPEDPFILKGSCGVEYRLVLTEAGEEKYGGRYWKKPGQTGAGTGGEGIASSIAVGLFWIAFISVLVYILYNIFFPSNRLEGNRHGGNNGWYPGDEGGGPGDDSPYDPPPPYTPRGSHQSKRTSADSSRSFFPRSYGATPTSSSNNNGAWRPGFWTGAAAGAATTYALGGRNSTRNQNPPRPGQAGPSSWFGGGRDEPRAQPTGTQLGGSPGFAGPSSFSSPSNTRYQSTGFGSTRRR